MLRRLEVTSNDQPGTTTSAVGGNTLRGYVPDHVRALFDAVADGLVIADAQGNLIDWNPAALRLHGFTSLEEVRHHLSYFTELFAIYEPNAKSPLPLDQWPMSRALRREPVRNLELIVHRLDIDRRWVISFDAAWVQSAIDDKPLERIVLTLRDMTAHREAEAARAQAQQDFRELVESLPQLVWTCTADGQCDYVSPQWVAYTGVRAAAHLGSGWLEVLHPDDREPTRSAWKRAVTSADVLDTEFRIRRVDGDYRWFRNRTVPIRDGRGAVTRWLGTNSDEHDQRLAADVQARLAAIVEHSDDAIISMTLDGAITSWNRSAERLFGYSADEIIGRKVAVLIPMNQSDEAAAILHQVRDGQGIDHVKSSYIAKGGRLIDVAITVSPLRDSAGRVVGISQIARDVTQEKRAAESLRESEARFRRLADAMPQIVWSRSGDDSLTYLNDRWKEHSGLESADPADIAKIVHPDDLIPMRTARDLALNKGEGYTIEFRMRNISGGPYRWYMARAVPVKDASGKVIEWFGTSTDIEDLKRIEERARDNEARLRGVLDGAVEGIVTIDDRGRIESVNAAVSRSFGYTPDEMIGQNVRMLMPSPYNEAHDVYLENYHRTGQRKIIGIGREVVGRRKDGSTFPVDLSVSEVSLGGRKIFTGIIRDITSRKAAEEHARVRQAEIAHLERVRTIGQMASGLAHELNQPLGAIANYTKASRMMLESATEDKRARVIQVLHEIQSEALRAGEIIHRLRGFVRKQLPNVTPTDLVELLDDALRLMAFELRHAGIKPTLALDDGLPSILVDRIQIGQVVVNLVRNALDAMQSIAAKDRDLLIAASQVTGGFVKLSISDRGCGISKEALPRIFDAFYTTKSTGLGIGLALSRTIIEDHGGRLTAENNPTGGMTFSITLRASPDAAGQGA